MTSEQQSVATWMTKFGQECPSKPTIPSFEIRKLRAKLILEEALETCLALGVDLKVENFWDITGLLSDLRSNDLDCNEDNGCVLSEVMDGVADSLVVNLGCAVAVGLDVEPFFREVMRSNDSKLWTNSEILEDRIHVTPGYSFECVGCKKGIECTCGRGFKTDRHWLVKDRDGKVIKSPSYSPADCEKTVIQQAESCNH